MELIANGNTSGTAWEVVGLVTTVANSAGAGSSAGMAGLKLKVSSTSQTTGYATIPAGASTPATATSVANTQYYFVLKRPTTLTAATPSNLAIFTPIIQQLGNVTLSGACYYAPGDSSSPGSSYSKCRAISF